MAEETTTEILNKESQSKSKRKRSLVKEIFDALLFALIIAIVLKLFFIEAYRIPTGSMEKTLLVGDFLLVNKFIYGATSPRNIPLTEIRLPYLRLPALREPRMNDVVVFDFPGERDEIKPREIVSYIKRLIGEPGDTIKIINRIVYVNGKAMENPENSYFTSEVQGTNVVSSRLFPKGCGWNEDNYGPLRVPKKGDILKITPSNFEGWKIFIQREAHTLRLTSDNKVFIDEKETSDYVVERDYYFMMGDHRTNSSDSRFWGFVPRELIVGEAMLIYWSWEQDIPFADFWKLLSSVRWSRIGHLVN